MKYIDADLLRKEIEKRKQIHFNDYFVKKSGNPADYGASNALAQVLPLIDSLQQEQQEEPDKSLEEAAEEYLQKVKAGFLRTLDHPTAKDCFIHGAEWQEKHDEEAIKTAEDHAFLAGADWQKEQMLKYAVEGYIGVHLTEEGSKVTVNSGYLPKEMGIKNGDKVRIVVLKEED